MSETHEQALQRISHQRAENLLAAHERISELEQQLTEANAENERLRSRIAYLDQQALISEQIEQRLLRQLKEADDKINAASGRSR